MNRTWKSLSLSAVAALAVTAPMALAVSPAHADEGSAVTFRLDSMKGTNATGDATLTPTADGGLVVEIRAKDMVPNSPHAQHIHGDTSGAMKHCPAPSADKDGNGFISIEEGFPDYGDIHISLTTTGDTTKASGLAVDRMPMADAQGNLSYKRTLTAAELPKGTLENLANLHVVQHGVDANDNGKYDMEGLGESTFAKSLGVDGIPAEATDSATCGMIMPAGGVATGGEAPTAPNSGLLAAGGVLLAGGAAVAISRRRSAAVTGA
ncbi:hypothetical protein [Tessaracoccus antarcticus]|uniref:CHRD domain-containing protein n=1 Tax=Tessaracoccus antarcticus TaxID=2479848 RepID=A0A3M0GCA9_9ACTN|nr:hypothetical protein [Tessaracoccus antarcticus]RMB62087.1 hypothetical protein EAX62_05785 [Tessaracoccus antarcticus]